MLIAHPDLQGAYAQTVIIAFPVMGRFMGYIVNRPTKITMQDAFPDHVASKTVKDFLYSGGPFGIEIMIAVTPHSIGESSIKLHEGVYVTSHGETIDHMIETTPNAGKYFVGLVAWKPGELEAEIKKGMWGTTKPDMSLFFKKTSPSLWNDLLRRNMPPGRNQLGT